MRFASEMGTMQLIVLLRPTIKSSLCLEYLLALDWRRRYDEDLPFLLISLSARFFADIFVWSCNEAPRALVCYIYDYIISPN